VHSSRFTFEARRYPATPGCYLMRDASGTVMYVGKAKDLRRRLASYFAGRALGRRLGQMVAQIAEIEVILVENETEALILEHNLIKHYRPRSNRMLMDEDDGYFYIALTAEALPRFAAYRKHRINKDLEKGGPVAVARTFGPYVSRRFRDTLLEFVSGHFRLRTCAPLPARVCLRYHLGTCGGICEAKVTAREYARAVRQATAFLARGHAGSIRYLKKRIAERAAQLQFESAQVLARQVEALEGALEPQVVERDVAHDQDVLYFGDGQVLVMQIRSGRVLGCSLRPLEAAPGAGDPADHYLRTAYAGGGPAELIVNRVGDRAAVAAALATASGQQVLLTLPEDGEDGGATGALLRLCERNYRYRLARGTR
jgi:excinuclease ABC subunit C